VDLNHRPQHYEQAAAKLALLPVDSISRSMVQKRHLQLTKESPDAANKSMRRLRALFNFGNGQYTGEDGRGLFPENPTIILTHNRTWNKDKQRKTVIKQRELAIWFNAVKAIRGNPMDNSTTVRITSSSFY